MPDCRAIEPPEARQQPGPACLSVLEADGYHVRLRRQAPGLGEGPDSPHCVDQVTGELQVRATPGHHIVDLAERSLLMKHRLLCLGRVDQLGDLRLDLGDRAKFLDGHQGGPEEALETGEIDIWGHAEDCACWPVRLAGIRHGHRQPRSPNDAAARPSKSHSPPFCPDAHRPGYAAASQVGVPASGPHTTHTRSIAKRRTMTGRGQLRMRPRKRSLKSRAAGRGSPSTPRWVAAPTPRAASSR
jgi:hypothetical protein